jgi:hypothetical protein
MSNEEELAKIISFTRKIESILKDKFKAKGKGLHTYIDSIKNMLDAQLIKDLRFIATIRNKSMHESTFKVDNFTSYQRIAESTIYRLNKLEIKKLKTPKENKSFIKILFVIVLTVAGFLYYSINNKPKEKISFDYTQDISLEKKPFTYKENIVVEKTYKKPSIDIVITSKNTKDTYKIAIKSCLAFNNMKHTKNKGNISLKNGYEYKVMKSQKNQLRIFIDYLSEKEVPHRWVDSNCFE